MGPLRELTFLEIENLASRLGVRRIAVENFLTSLDGLSAADARGNLRLDAGLYRWGAATIAAIEEGIRLAARRKS